MRFVLFFFLIMPLFGQYEFLPQIGNGVSAKSIAVSINGKFIVSGDNTIKV